MLKVYHIWLHAGQEISIGSLYIRIKKCVQEKRSRVSLARMKSAPNAPGGEPFPLLPLFTEEITVAIIPIKDKYVVTLR
jgi:hypothetical protein